MLAGRVPPEVHGPPRGAIAERGPRGPAAPWPWRIAVVAALCFAAITAQRHIGLSLRDEGFLWYGAQRVLEGELPLRDFQAYDPGRYFWVAGWMAVLGDDGILALRWANAALAAVNVALATWVVASGSKRPGWASLLVTGAIFTLWTIPHFKAADGFAVVMLLFGLTRLLQRPSLHRYFQGGGCLGLASTIGINHALYGVIAALLALLHLRGAPHRWRAIGAAVAGGALGYSPVLALHVFAPGFAAAFVDSVVQLFEYGTTNLEVPIPNLREALQVRDKGPLLFATKLLLALFFLAVPLLWILAAWGSRSPGGRAVLSAPVLAGVLLSVPYFHYAYSRADLLHVAISILPVLAGGLAWILGSAGDVLRPLLLTGALGGSLVMTLLEQPAYYVLRGNPTVALNVDGAGLLVHPANAAEIRAARTVAAAAGPTDFFAGPYLPGAYALAKRRSPTWEIYMLFPATPARQRAEIERIKAANIRFALISSERVDGRSDLGLEQTHSLLLAYLRRCLDERVNFPAAPQFSLLLAVETACRLRERNKPDVDAKASSRRAGGDSPRVR